VAITEDSTRKLWAFPSNLAPVQRIAGVRRVLAEGKRRWIYRRDLKRLLCVGEYMIDDIGLSLEDAHDEIDKPFWQL
jgi:uncharacterized protein YjiS (DUF1127 family)